MDVTKKIFPRPLRSHMADLSRHSIAVSEPKGSGAAAHGGGAISWGVIPHRSRRLQENQEQEQIAFDIVSQEEIFLDVLVAVFSQLPGKSRIGEKETNLVGGALHRMHQHPGRLVT